MNAKRFVEVASILMAAAIAIAYVRAPVEIRPGSPRSNKTNNASSLSAQQLQGSTPKSSSYADAQDVTDLLKRMQSMQQELDAIKRRNDPDLARQSADTPLTLAEQEQQERERTRQTTAFLESNFVAEMKDPAWSLQTERQLADTFNNDGIADASQLQQLSCQATLCRIHSHHNDSTAERVFLTRLGRLDSFGDAEAFSERMEQADGSIEIVTYVTRNGHRLPSFQ